jgi:predicted transcriptional regulator
MSVWENIPECKRKSIENALYRFNRVQIRKDKIKRLYDKSKR